MALIQFPIDTNITIEYSAVFNLYALDDDMDDVAAIAALQKMRTKTTRNIRLKIFQLKHIRAYHAVFGDVTTHIILRPMKDYTRLSGLHWPALEEVCCFESMQAAPGLDTLFARPLTELTLATGAQLNVPAGARVERLTVEHLTREHADIVRQAHVEELGMISPGAIDAAALDQHLDNLGVMPSVRRLKVTNMAGSRDFCPEARELNARNADAAFMTALANPFFMQNLCVVKIYGSAPFGVDVLLRRNLRRLEVSPLVGFFAEVHAALAESKCLEIYMPYSAEHASAADIVGWCKAMARNTVTTSISFPHVPSGSVKTIKEAFCKMLCCNTSLQRLSSLQGDWQNARALCGIVALVRGDGRNRTLWRCSGPATEDNAESVYLENRAWSRVAFIVGFMRANRGHRFRDSGLTPDCLLQAMTLADKSKQDLISHGLREDFVAPEPASTASKLLDSKFVQNELRRVEDVEMPAAAAAAAAPKRGTKRVLSQ